MCFAVLFTEEMGGFILISAKWQHTLAYIRDCTRSESALKTRFVVKETLLYFLDVFSAILFIHQIHFVYRGGGLLLWKVKVLDRT